MNPLLFLFLTLPLALMAGDLSVLPGKDTPIPAQTPATSNHIFKPKLEILPITYERHTGRDIFGMSNVQSVASNPSDNANAEAIRKAEERRKAILAIASNIQIHGVRDQKAGILVFIDRFWYQPGDPLSFTMKDGSGSSLWDILSASREGSGYKVTLRHHESGVEVDKMLNEQGNLLLQKESIHNLKVTEPN